MNEKGMNEQKLYLLFLIGRFSSEISRDLGLGLNRKVTSKLSNTHIKHQRI